MRLEILVANLTTNFQDLIATVKNLVALAPVLGTILRPVIRTLPLQISFHVSFPKIIILSKRNL